ncbi:hypothetical protein Anas_13930, partial [Armadillidium nasatum]
ALVRRRGIWGSNRPPIKLSYKSIIYGPIQILFRDNRDIQIIFKLVTNSCVSDPEELSSDFNGNAGHKPISRKMKLDDGVDTEDSFAVATSSAAMPKLEICKQDNAIL